MGVEVYRVLHFVSLIIVTSCMGIGYFSQTPKKWARILGMSSSLILMIAGMGLLARIYPGQPWPLWVKIKILIWSVLAIGSPVAAKRLKKNKEFAYFFFMCLFVGAIILAVVKPFF